MKRTMRIRALAWAAGAIAVVALPAPLLAQAEGARPAHGVQQESGVQQADGVRMVHACYARGTGQVYRIRVEGRPDSCTSRAHIEFSWPAHGPTGPVGPVGPRGAVGDQGAQGPTGQQGEQGEPGALGSQGPEGEPGAQGADGAQGPQGPQGPDGGVGPAGEDGAPGPVGPAGPKGPTGPDGPQGDQGPAGPDGPAYGDCPGLCVLPPIAPPEQGPAGEAAPRPMNRRILTEDLFVERGSPLSPNRRTVTVWCDAGEFVVSGGFHAEERVANPISSSPRTLDGVMGWTVSMANWNVFIDDNVEVTAICVRPI